MYRSTKGASKARRDQINAEIRNLKELLPITDPDKSRLSYLQVMSLACMYTRKSAFFSQETRPQEQSRGVLPFHDLLELMHELSGFMLILTGEGKLLYLSENVAQHLGLGMVDLVVQSDSVYDIIDPVDHLVMRSSIATAAPGYSDRLFRCRFSASKFLRRPGADNKPMLLRARYLPLPCSVSSYWTSNPVWVCFCTPLTAKPPTEYHSGPKGSPLTPPFEHNFLLASFHSQHHMDMRLIDVQDSVTAYLGYEVDYLRSRSWYSLLHPRDLSHASAQHRALLREGGERQMEMVVQVEAADHSWVWLYMFLQLSRGEQQHINCNNYVINESEAWSLREQLCWEQNRLAGCYSSGDCMNLRSSETLESPERIFTPSSGGSSAQSVDFTAATSAVSFSDEATQPACPAVQSNLSSLEEESSTQTHGQWNPEFIHASSIPALNSSPVFLTEPESDIWTQRVPSHLASQSELLPTKLCAPVTMMGGFACSPTYTSHISRGCISFGERLRFHLNPTAASWPQNSQAIVSPEITQALSSDSPSLLLPTEYNRKMPAPTDSFRLSGCHVMALPEISGPLYVPERSFCVPPEEVLTPERSPTTQRSMEKEQERETEEISLLARYIGSLAEGFYCDPLLPKQTSSVRSPSPTLKPPSPNYHCGCEFYPKRGLNRPLHHKHTSLYEESMLLEILIQDMCSFPPPPSSYSSTSNSHPSSSSPRSPQTPVNCCAPSHCNGEYPIEADHVRSIQSMQFNCRAVGGALMLASGGVTMRNMEESPENMAMDVSPPSTTLAASQEPPSVLGLAHPTRAHGLPHAQFFMEELAAMDQVFEADASIPPRFGAIT